MEEGGTWPKKGPWRVPGESAPEWSESGAEREKGILGRGNSRGLSWPRGRSILVCSGNADTKWEGRAGLEGRQARAQRPGKPGQGDRAYAMGTREPYRAPSRGVTWSDEYGAFEMLLPEDFLAKDLKSQLAEVEGICPHVSACWIWKDLRPGTSLTPTF